VAGAVLWPCAAVAQPGARPIRLGVVAAFVRSSELDTRDAGVGMLTAWHPIPLVGAEVEVVVHPADSGPDPAFSGGRVETMFGVTIGPRLGALRLFAKARPGIIRFWEAPEPIACIAIFPPPIRCTLASGRTVVAFDVGGGVEIAPSARTFVRVDAGDRMLSFPGPVRESTGPARERGFFAHDLRVAIAVGLRF
jgi:hypothetical protein